MYPPILCMCGRSLGDLYDLFQAMRVLAYVKAYAEAGFDIDPANLPVSESIQVLLWPDLVALHIHLDCCRARMLTAVEFKSLYV
jgi:DNA-directed RNA polymerase subunit N (RpoN/RPB10)